MAAPLRRPVLPRVVLWFGGAAPVLIVGGFILALGVAGVSQPSQRGSEYLITVPLLAVVAGLLAAIAAIACGHVAWHRYPHETRARVGLWIGYGTLGVSLVLGGAMVATWWSIMQYR